MKKCTKYDGNVKCKKSIHRYERALVNIVQYIMKEKLFTDSLDAVAFRGVNVC